MLWICVFLWATLWEQSFLWNPFVRLAFTASACLSGQREQDGRSIYHGCRIDSIKLTEKAASRATFSAATRKTSGYRPSRTARPYEPDIFPDLAEPSRQSIAVPILVPGAFRTDLRKELSVCFPVRFCSCCCVFNGISFLLLLECKGAAVTQTHFYLSGVMSSLEQIPPAADLLPKLYWCRAVETDLFC